MRGRRVVETLLMAGVMGMATSCSGDGGTGPGNDPVDTNLPPSASMTASVTSGYAPLTVFFGGGGTDGDGTIVKIEWDFDGDGTFDETSTVNSADPSLGTEHTYEEAGVYTATIRVTDDDGATATATEGIQVLAAAYAGFQDLTLRTGGYWTYNWVGTNATNLNSGTRKAGVVKVTLGSSLPLSSGLTIYSTTVTELGDPFPLAAPFEQYGYVGVRDGVLYKAKRRDGTNTYDVWTVFDPRAGTIGENGLLGYFREEVQEHFTSGVVSNRYLEAPGVTVRELWSKPYCRTIAGVQICDDEAWVYETEEYFIPPVGFAGVYRSGTYSWSSPFPGGSTSSTVLLGLTDTNMGVIPGDSVSAGGLPTP
jgi:PKD repeat protein